MQQLHESPEQMLVDKGTQTSPTIQETCLIEETFSTLKAIKGHFKKIYEKEGKIFEIKIRAIRRQMERS